MTGFFLVSLLGVLASGQVAKADAINETRILRKAAGIATGKLSKVKFSSDGGPLQSSFDRTGKVRIPNSEGPEATTVIHGTSVPDPEFNTPTKGNVTKAEVRRLGKQVVYAGNGVNDYFDDAGDFKGGGNAQSNIRGTKVLSTGTVRGNRVNTVTSKTEAAQGVVSGRSTF